MKIRSWDNIVWVQKKPVSYSKWKCITGYCTRYGRIYQDNAEDQHDLLQEIMLQLWLSYYSFRGDSDLFIFVSVILKGRVLRFWLPTSWHSSVLSVLCGESIFLQNRTVYSQRSLYSFIFFWLPFTIFLILTAIVYFYGFVSIGAPFKQNVFINLLIAHAIAFIVIRLTIKQKKGIDVSNK